MLLSCTLNIKTPQTKQFFFSPRIYFPLPLTGCISVHLFASTRCPSFHFSIPLRRVVLLSEDGYTQGHNDTYIYLWALHDLFNLHFLRKAGCRGQRTRPWFSLFSPFLLYLLGLYFLLPTFCEQSFSALVLLFTDQTLFYTTGCLSRFIYIFFSLNSRLRFFFLLTALPQDRFPFSVFSLITPFHFCFIKSH